MARAPSQAYLRSSKAGYERTNASNLQLIVLDLNGTLVWRPDRARSGHPPKLRRGLRDFTKFLFDNFAVMIWSSSSPASVSRMCRAIFTADQMDRLVAVWARDTLGLTPAEYNSKVQTYKNLDWLWENRHLRTIKQFSQLDTLIVDDSLEKVVQHPNNIIVVPEYTRELHDSGTDSALSIITSYLRDLQTCTNISAYMAENQIQFEAVKLADSKDLPDVHRTTTSEAIANSTESYSRSRTSPVDGILAADTDPDMSKGQKRNQRREAQRTRETASEAGNNI